MTTAKKDSRFFRSTSSNARRTRMKITPRFSRFTATSKTICSATKFSSSCSPFTASPKNATSSPTIIFIRFFICGTATVCTAGNSGRLSESEHKDVTTKTNGFGDVETVAGHDKFFALWPFYFKDTGGIGTDDPEKSRGSLPFYMQTRSTNRDSTSVLWPFFAWIDDREKKYREWQGPWPFVIFTRGEGKTTSRVWPLFSQSHNDEMESDSYLWPIYQMHRLHADPLDRRRTRLLFYLYDDMTEKNTETGAEKRRIDALPFFTYHRDFNGNSRLQILALIEPAVPDNRGVERNWSPLWSIWVSEDNLKTGARSRSLLWNLYRCDTAATSKKCSLLFGLFQYQSSVEMKKLRIFYLPVFWSRPQSVAKR